MWTIGVARGCEHGADDASLDRVELVDFQQSSEEFHSAKWTVSMKLGDKLESIIQKM
jgi:hypothetical protein